MRTRITPRSITWPIVIELKGSHGFEELLKYVKQGSDLCKDVFSVLQERSELECGYGKSLSKLASRLAKATAANTGTLVEAWTLVGTEMEAEADQHRQLSVGISEKLCKVLKTQYETHSKNRKMIETAVDKYWKTLTDRRETENKCKKTAASTAKEREKFYNALSSLRETGGKNVEKDIMKLEKKLKQLNENLSKADKDFFDSSKKAESARQDHESAVYKASGQLQVLDEERICKMQLCLDKYNNLLSAIPPRLEKSLFNLTEAHLSVNVQNDINKVIEKRSPSLRISEHLLPDFYAEDMQLAMDVNRRKEELQYCSSIVAQETEREKRTLEGIQKMGDVYRTQPSFADGETREEVELRLCNVNVMLRWLEACDYKFRIAMSALDGGSRPNSLLSQYFEQARDKQGNLHSVLKYPCVASQQYDTNRPGVTTRMAISMYSSDDEFSDSQCDSIGNCRAIYAYEAQHHDELTLRQGDVIAICEKQPDGWWKGELNGKLGVFPSTYVQEQ